MSFNYNLLEDMAIKQLEADGFVVYDDYFMARDNNNGTFDAIYVMSIDKNDKYMYGHVDNMPMKNVITYANKWIDEIDKSSNIDFNNISLDTIFRLYNWYGYEIFFNIKSLLTIIEEKYNTK